MSEYSSEKEIAEAVNAGNEALYHLEKARDLLNGAKNWGIVDIFGGGLFTTMLKRSKMSDAQSEIEQSKVAMDRLKEELSDIRNFPQVDLDMDSFLGFADYFFDGVLADWFTQSKINDARAQVDEAIAEVEGILDGLSDMEDRF
jgi:hypothetical protein